MNRSTDLVEWAAARLPMMHGRPFEANATAIGVEDAQGTMMGVIVFSDWQPQYGTIQVSAVADDPRWMRAREAFDAMWRYCWEICKVQKIWSATPSQNTRALRFVWGLGFKQEAILERHYGDDDCIVSRIFHDEWKAARMPN